MDCRYSSTRSDARFRRNPLRHLTGTLALCLATLLLNIFFSPAYAQMAGETGYHGEGPNARVRIGFELREISAEDANKIINGTVTAYDADNRWGPGYIDLWTYAYFDVVTFQKYAVYSAISRKTSWKLLPRSNTISFVLQDKAGNTDNLMTNARIAPAEPAVSGSELSQAPLKALTYLSNFDYGNAYDYNGGALKGYGMHSSSSSGENIGDYDAAVEIITMEGQQFYRIKMFMVRFELKKAGSFYANFVCNGDIREDWSMGTTNWNLYNIENGSNAYLCDLGQNTQNDFVIAGGANKLFPMTNPTVCSYPDAMKFLQGGVEIVSGFEATLTPTTQTLCPNDPATTTLTITRFKNTSATWNTGVKNPSVQYFDRSTNTWVGTTAVANSGSDASTTPYFSSVTNPNVVPSSAGSPVATLKVPAGWHRNTRDSLRLNITVTGGASSGASSGADTVYRFPFGIKFYEDLHLKTSFAAGSISNFNGNVDVYGKKEGKNGDKDTIVGIESGATVSAFAASKYLNNPLSSKKTYTGWTEKDEAFAATYDITVTTLMYSPTLTGNFTSKANNAGSLASLTLENSGYYCIVYTIDGNEDGNEDDAPDFPQAGNCEYISDTVYVKVKKPLAMPTLSFYVGEECAYDQLQINAVAQDYTSVDGWEWGIGDNANKDYPQDNLENHSKWVKIIGAVSDIQVGGAFYDEDYSLSYTTTEVSGTNKSQFIANMTDLAQALAGYNMSLLCAPMHEFYNSEIAPEEPESNACEISDMWPKYVTGNNKLVFSTPYIDHTTSNPGIDLVNSAIYARYIKDGEYSPWGVLVPSCEDPDIRGMNACYGIAVNPECISSQAKNNPSKNFYPPTCSDPNVEVEAGETVTLRCFIDFNQTVTTGKYAPNEILKKNDLFTLGFAIEWQVKENGVWQTFHISGKNSMDKGVLKTYTNGQFKIPYIETTRVVNKDEDYRILVKDMDCSRTPNCSYIGGTESMGGGKYDLEVSATIKKGKLYIGKTGEDINKGAVNICDGETIDLSLIGATFPAGTPLKWQQSYDPSDPNGWFDAIGITSGTSTTVTGITPGVAADEQELYDETILEYAGVPIYYRVVVDGTPVGNVLVTVRKAPKVYAYTEKQGGVHKSEKAGYCSDDQVTIKPVTAKNGTTAADISLNYDFQLVQDPEDFYDGFVGTTGKKTITYSNGTGAGYHRIQTENNGCYEYSDTVKIEIHKNPNVGIAPDTTVCVGPNGKASVTVRATGDKMDSYTWMYVSNASYALDKALNETGATYTREYPIYGTAGTAAAPHEDIVLVSGYNVYGDKNGSLPQDTVHCVFYNEDVFVTIKTIECKPELVIAGRTTICAGTSDTLGWVIDDKFSAFVCGTDKLYYAKEPYSTWVEMSTADYSCAPYIEDGDEVGTYLILKATSTVTTTPGKYKFKAAKNGVGSESEPTDVLTVNAKPKITSLTVSVSPAAMCLNDKATSGVSASASALPAGSYTYIWKKNNSVIPTATSSSYKFVANGATVGYGDTGTYMVRAVLTANGCASDPDSATAQFKINPLPTAATVVMGENKTVCAGGSATLTVKTRTGDNDATNNDYSYQWYKDPSTKKGSATSTYQPLTISSAAAGDGGDYYLLIETTVKATGCKTTSAVPTTKTQLTVTTCSDPEIADIAACPEDDVKSFTLTTPPGVQSIAFTLSDGTTTAGTITPAASSTVQSYTLTPSTKPTATTTYKVVVTLSGGVTKTLTPKYTIHTLPTATVGWANNPTTVCEGDPVCMSPKISGTNIEVIGTWLWEHKGKVYIATDKPAQGGHDKIESQGGNRNCFYDAPLDSAGTYKVSREIKDKTTGCKNTVEGSVTLTVKPLPAKPGIEPMDNQDVCANVDATIKPTVTVDNTSGVSTTYKWYYTVNGSEPTASTPNPFTGKDFELSHNGASSGLIMPASGTIKARLYITSTLNGCSIDSMGPVVTITVNPKPTVAATVADKTICAGASHTFEPTGLTPDPSANSTYKYEYRWSAASGSTAGTVADNKDYTVATDADATAQKINNYTFVYKVTTDKGCFDSVIKNPKLTVNARTKVSITKDITDQEICEGASTSFVATASGASKYEWYKASTATGPWTKQSASTATLSFSAAATTDAGFYKLLAFSTSGCPDSAWSSVKELTVHPKAIKPVIADMAEVKLCQGETGHTLTATVTSAAQSPGESTQKWYLTNTTSAAVGSGTSYGLPATTYNTAGTYTYIYKQVNITDKNCKDSAQQSVTVKVNATPTVSSVSITGDDDYCTHNNKTANSMTLTANASPAAGSGVTVKYQWFKDAGATPVQDAASNTYTKTAATTDAGSYTVKAIYTLDGCADTATSDAKAVAVTQTPTIAGAAITPATENICAGDSFEFAASATITGATSTTYQWKKGSGNLSGSTTDKYGKTSGTNKADDEGGYSVVITAVKTTDKGKECKAWEEPTATLTVTDLPDLGSVTIASDATDDKACTELTLTATAKNAAGTAISSGVTYQWQKYNGTDWENVGTASSTKTYKVTTIGDNQKYRCVASMGVSGSTCGKSVTSAEKTVTVLTQPAITSVTVSQPDPLCVGSDVTLTATVSPATPNAGTYTYAWKKGTTALSGTTASLALTNLATSDAGSYTCTVTATNDICTADKSGSTTLTVVDTIRFTGTKITDSRNGDTCMKTGNFTLTVAGAPTGKGNLSYAWTLPGGSTAVSPGDNKTLTVPHALVNSGKYKVKVTLAPTTANPCGNDTTLEIDVKIVMCGNEPLKPGTAGQQNNDIALVCEKGNENTTIEVTFEPTAEKAAVTEVKWMKYASAPDANSTAEGTPIKTVAVDASTSWPLHLNHSEVFDGSETLPAQYYVRAKVTRTGNVVNFTDNYRFVKVKNAPKVEPTMKPADTTVCINETVIFAVGGTKPADPANPFSLNTATSEDLKYFWKKPDVSSFSLGNSSMTAVTSNVVTGAEYQAYIVSGYKYQVNGTRSATNTCYDTSSTIATGKLTVKAKPTFTSVVDADGNTSSTICANATAYPELTATYTNAETVQWEHTAGGITNILSAAADKNKYQLLDADVTKPAAGAADIANVYKVTVGNGVCASVSKTYTLTVMSMPNLTDVLINGKIPAPEFEFCGDGILTAQPKSGNADYSGTPAPTYKWQTSSATGADDSWTDVTPNGTSKTRNLTAPDNNYYRCIVTATKTAGACPVSDTSTAVQVTVSAGSSKGTATIDKTAICNSENAVFNVTGQTGDITKIEISNSNSFPAGTNTVEITSGISLPYTIDPKSTTPNIAGLLTSRKTTLYVRATVRSGGVCTAVTTDVKSVDVYKPHDGIGYTLPDGVLCAATNVTYTPAINSEYEEIVWTIKTASGTTRTSTSTASTGYINTVGLEPKWNQDTSYTLEAVVNNTKVDGGCDGINATPKTFKVGRKAVAPVVSAGLTLCEGSDYEVWANRPAEAELTWSLTKDGTAAACGTPGVSGQKETVSVTDAAPGAYIYTAKDATACDNKTSTINVTVKEKAVAKTITLSGNGSSYCSANDITITASDYKPTTGATIQWQVSTDTTDATSTVNKGTGATLSKPGGLTAGTQYFVRYVVKGDAPCGDSASKWVPFKIFESPQISGASVTDKICEGSDITIAFTAEKGYTYTVYSNGSNATTGGTQVATGTVPDGGSVSLTTSAVYGKGHFYVVVTDPDGNGVTCATKTQYLGVTDIDRKVTAGDLTITAPQSGDVINAKVGQTVTLQITGTTPAGAFTEQIMWVSAKVGATPDYASASALGGTTQQLTSSHQDTTYYWTKVTSRLGLCDAAYSDTVKVYVELGNKPTLEVKSPICQSSSDVELTVSNIQDSWKNEFKWDQIQWQYRVKGASAWTDITSGMGTINQSTGKVTYTPSPALSAGEYEFQYKYKIGENDAVWIEDPATLRVDALSVGGKLASTDDTVCQNGTRPVLSLSGHTGTITGTYFGTTDFPANPTQVSTGTDATNLYQVPTANQSGSGYYRVMVKSGVCPEAYSDTIEVRVIQTPVAGTLSQQTLCFDNDTKEVVYSGGTGSNLIWQQASTENGPYADITPTATNKYEVGPLTDHIWVKVIVNTHSVCAADTVKREVKVYDTLKIKTQPDDVTVTGTGKSATFTVAAETAGLKYADASNTLEPVTPKTYTWEYSEDGGTTWGSLPGTNHTASNGTLTVSNAELYEGKLYRCTITSNPCDRSVVSKAVTIKANAKLVPGETKSRTECDCYYPTDSVIYFVQGAAGEGKLTYRWQISTMDNPDAANAAHWTNLEAVSGLTGKYTVDTNRIVFLQMQNLDEAHAKWIRAWVKDEASPEEPTTGNLVKICRQPKPTYTFEGNIVCERTSGTAELLFKYTANPNHIDGRSIKYAYALPSDPTNFTEINIPNGSNTNTSVSLPNSKSLTFTVKAADTSLVIPASSAIPFEADSMIIRMEVRSCYTPDPDQNTDTTMYVLLRVDAPVRITRRAPDTIMCVGTSFDMETGFAMRNKTIPDNEVTAKWYSPTQFHEKTAKFYTTQEGTAVLDFKNLTEDDAGIWYVDLSTEYCPAVTDSITVGVHKVPAFNGDITPAEVCKGITATLTATIDATATTDYTLQWQRKNGTSWEDVTDGTEDGATYSGATTTTLSITNTDVAQAGEYRLNLVVTLASCEGTLSKESSVTVRLVPEVTLNPHYKVQLQEGGNRDVKVTWNTPTQPFVTVAEPTGYEWRAQAPEANSFSKMTGSEPFVEGNVQDQQTIKIVAPGKAYDSTLFYAKVTTGCGTVETKWDTLRIFEGFAISNVTPTVGDGQTDPIIPPACEGEDVDIVVETNAPATYVEWHVSTNGGTTWTALSPLPDARYDSAWEDGVYTLTIHNVTTGMEGWMYRVKVHDAEMTWDSSDKWVVKLHIDKPVKFTCPKGVFEESAGKEPAVVIGGSPENSVFSFKVLCASTACPYTDHACDLTYAYERSKPALGVTQRDDYSLEDSASTYTFTPPATDTGLNLIRFIASNHCGGDTVYDSVMVINVINPGPITAIERLPEPDPELPDDIKQEVVDSNPIDFTVCDSNYVWFAASFTPKTTYPTHWEISGDGNSWNPIALGGAYSVNGDSLIIKPVSIAADMDGKMFRRVLELPGKIAPVYSHAFTLHITPLPDKSPFSLTIRDADDDAMQDGDVREAHQVVFNIYDTVSGVSADGYTKLCVMRYVNKDSVEEVICQEAPFSFPLQIPSFTAEVEKHDSTLYFIQAYNDCGKVLSDLRLLRVYDTLIVRWVADTIIYTDKGDDWSVDSLDEIVPGRLIDVYSALDSTPMQAHVFLCDSTYAHFADTTLKGFMNPLSWSGSATKNSRWWMKLPNDEEWRYASTALWAQFGFEHQATIEPYYGMFTLEDDGLQIKGWGVNNLYCDSTSVLTIHMLPGLDEGDLSMTPAEVSLCESAPGNDQTFEISSRRYEGELWEMAAAAYNFKWQYSTPESEAWIDVDSLDGRALWHFGAVKAEHDGWKIRAFASVPCGTDTVEAVIRVTPSLTPVVRLVSDSACLGDTLTFTASTENMGENPVFEWFVDGVKVEGANGAQYKVAGLAAGEHKIEVRATLTDATLCVSPDNASAEEVAVVYDLPRIEAFIADTLMKNTDTTSVWVKGQGDYTYAWTPETGLLEPTADSTLLWGLEPQQEPHVYVVTATDENGCQAQDSVWVRIESNFTIDSFSIVVVVPPVLDLDGGRLPGYPEEPEDSYYPELGGTPFGGELMFRDDTVADLWICAHNTALIHFNVRGGEKPITYKWRIEDGNAKPVYPVDVKEDEYYSFTEPDSVFGIFFPDTSTHTMRCEIRDLTGAGGAITIYVHYYKPEMFYLEVTPKVTSGKYYEQQAMNFFVRPDRDWLTTWVDVRNGKMVDTVTNRKMNRQMSFTKEEGDETSIWISTVDRHGCRIWDSVPIHIIPLPNVLLVGDPINGVIFPEFEVEITNTWGLKVKGFEDRNGNGSSRGWDGRTKSGTYVAAGTYYYRAKIPTLDKKGYMIVNGAVTVVNK